MSLQNAIYIQLKTEVYIHCTKSHSMLFFSYCLKLNQTKHPLLESVSYQKYLIFAKCHNSEIDIIIF